MLCRIQWIDCNGDATPDSNLAVGYVTLRPTPTARFPICAKHLRVLDPPSGADEAFQRLVECFVCDETQISPTGPCGPEGSLMNAIETIQRAQSTIASRGGTRIADMVSWNVGNIDTPRETARAVFAGIDSTLIPDIEPATALSRAVAEVSRPKGLLVRAFARPKGDTTASYGVYMQSANGEAGDGWTCGARVRVDTLTGVVVALAPDGGTADADCLGHAGAIAVAANHLVTHAETRDVSYALVATAKRLAGVPMRNRGGFYLLAPSSGETWAAMESGLRGIGVDPIRVELFACPANTTVAASAAAGSLEADIHELVADLQQAAGEAGMRKHALRNRIDACRELAAKAELFRDVLAGKATEIEENLAKLRAGFESALAGDEVFISIPVVEDDAAQ